MSTAGFEPGSSIEPSYDDRPVPVVSKDTAFMILKNWRRREVLRFLAESEEETTLDVLARHIAAKENGIDKRALSSSQRKRVYIGLYQAHLPKMDDAGVIEFDKHRGRVELRPDALRLLKYLHDPPRTGAKPGWYVATAASVGLLTWFGAPPLLDGQWLIGGVILAVAAVGIHAFYAERAGLRGVTTPGATAGVADGIEWRHSEPR